MHEFQDNLPTYVYCARTRIDRYDFKRLMPKDGWVTGPNGGPSIKNGNMSRQLDWLATAATVDFDFDGEPKLCRNFRLSAPFSPLMDAHDFNAVWRDALSDASWAIGLGLPPAVFSWNKGNADGYCAKWQDGRFNARLTCISGLQGRRIIFHVDHTPPPKASMGEFFTIEYS